MRPSVVRRELHMVVHAMIYLKRKRLIVARHPAENIGQRTEPGIGPGTGETRRGKCAGIERSPWDNCVGQGGGRHSEVLVDEIRQLPTKTAKVAGGDHGTPANILFQREV